MNDAKLAGKDCTVTAFYQLLTIVRDHKPLALHINADKLEQAFNNGANPDDLFDIAAKHCDNGDIKKDILMYKRWSKCDFSDQ